MGFKRSPDGISSEHLFYRVDFVAYCEGHEDIDGEVASLDVLFWQRAFNAYSRKNVYCKAYGSKNELLDIIELIFREELNHTIVVMDRDYDDFFNRMHNHDRVVYTFGYSWECDAIMSMTFSSVFTMFAPTPRIAQIENEYQQFLASVETNLTRCAVLDIKYYFSKTALFDRKKPQSILSFSRASAPRVNIKRVLDRAKLIEDATFSGIARDNLISSNGMHRFYGKAVARLVYHWFLYRSANLRNSPKLTFISFMAAVINSISWSSFQSFPALVHLRDSIARAVA